METIELFKIIGKRVTKLPPAQQEDIIETMLNLIDATERMNRSAGGFGGDFYRQQQPGFNLTKSASSYALTGGADFDPLNAAGMDGMGALTSSPSNLL